MKRPCLEPGCPHLTTGTRCPQHEAARQQARNQARPHYQGNWPALSRKLRAEHLATHGPVCPGWGTPPHPATDLVVDHITDRDTTHLQVLCRACNSRKSANNRHDR